MVALMDLFELFQEPTPMHNTDEFKQEFSEILKRHGVEAPDALLGELAQLWTDPPPWGPW